MKSEHLFIIRLGDGRHFEYEGTLDGAKRKASKLATPVSYTHLTLPTICSV